MALVSGLQKQGYSKLIPKAIIQNYLMTKVLIVLAMYHFLLKIQIVTMTQGIYVLQDNGKKLSFVA